MDELICRSLKSQASEAEETQLREWREADPANEARYRETAWLLETTGEALAHVSVPPPPPVATLVQRASRRRSRADHASPWRRASVRWGSGLALAAAAVIAWLVL